MMTILLIFLVIILIVFWLFKKIFGGVWKIFFKPITDDLGDEILHRIMRAGNLNRKQAKATISATLLAIIAIVVAIIYM